MERSRDLQQLHAIRLQASEELSWPRKFNKILYNAQFSQESIFRADRLYPRACYLDIDSKHFKPTSQDKSNDAPGAASIDYATLLEALIMAATFISGPTYLKKLWIGNFCRCMVQAVPSPAC
jgi:hypothetical protein